MKIRFIVETKDGEWPFTIDTHRLPYSIGNKEIALKDFSEVYEDASQPSVEEGRTKVCAFWGNCKFVDTQECCERCESFVPAPYFLLCLSSK